MGGRLAWKTAEKVIAQLCNASVQEMTQETTDIRNAERKSPRDWKTVSLAMVEGARLKREKLEAQCSNPWFVDQSRGKGGERRDTNMRRVIDRR